MLASMWAPDRPVSVLATRWATGASQFVVVNDVAAARGAAGDGAPERAAPEGVVPDTVPSGPTASAATLRVHLRDEGPRIDSVPLVLLHGASASLHTWNGWAERLARHERVLRLDLPGFGLTGPAPSGAYRAADFARFTLALLDSLGVDRFAVAGNSLGGEVAWHVAAAAPERVAALVLVDAAGFPARSTSEPIGFRLARQPGFAWLLEHMLPRAVIRSSLESAYGDPSRVSDSLVDRYYELTLREGNRGAMRARATISRDARDTLALKRLSVPTLILWGERDGVIPVANARRFQRDLPHSRLLVYPELGHVPHEEAPERTVADVEPFLRGIAPPE